jgi:hypothetical protein
VTLWRQVAKAYWPGLRRSRTRRQGVDRLVLGAVDLEALEAPSRNAVKLPRRMLHGRQAVVTVWLSIFSAASGSPSPKRPLSRSVRECADAVDDAHHLQANGLPCEFMSQYCTKVNCRTNFSHW